MLQRPPAGSSRRTSCRVSQEWRHVSIWPRPPRPDLCTDVSFLWERRHRVSPLVSVGE
jgi:hypothetical protein